MNELPAGGQVLFLAPLAVADWVWLVLRGVVMLVGLGLAAGTVLSLTRLTHWIARSWDFPRVQIALLAVACGVAAVALAALQGGPGPWDAAFLALMLAVTAWQAWCIREYTPLAGVQVQRGQGEPADPQALRIVITNVLQDNRRFDRWRSVVKAQEPDLVVAAEVDGAWVQEIGKAFDQSHPHRILQPQDNQYGMALWSRLPLENERVEFIVQEDVPSIHADLRLRNGAVVRLHSLHPRPPAPQEDDSSGPRDAELVLMGNRIREERGNGMTEPTLVVGDLNDVAWSRTTKLFQKLSGLLDPRRGRGMYNTFNANSRWLRFPLDHVFISGEFRLLDLRVLEHVGSDHFPICITVSLEPRRQEGQAVLAPDADDVAEARQTVQTQIEQEEAGEEDGHVTESRGGTPAQGKGP